MVCVLDVCLPECLGHHIIPDPPDTRSSDGRAIITHMQGDIPLGPTMPGYNHLNRDTPKPGVRVQTPAWVGVVVSTPYP